MNTAYALAVGPAWTWGDRLRKVRRDIAGISQGDLAALLGVNTATLSSWEGNRATPHRMVAESLANRIEELFPGRVTAAWLLGVEPQPGHSRSVGEDDEPNFIQLSEGWLPRMDSNHQPCDWRSNAAKTAVPSRSHSHPPIVLTKPRNPHDPLGFAGASVEQIPLEKGQQHAIDTAVLLMICTALLKRCTLHPLGRAHSGRHLVSLLTRSTTSKSLKDSAAESHRCATWKACPSSSLRTNRVCTERTLAALNAESGTCLCSTSALSPLRLGSQSPHSWTSKCENRQCVRHVA